MAGRIRVLIADDHPVVRQGLRSFLELQDELEVVGEAADGAEAVAMTGATRPEVVLLDLVMPRTDGIQAIRGIRQASPETKVIVLTTFADDDKVFPAVRAGASGYLLKDIHPHQLVEAIRTVHRGESLLHPKVASKLMQRYADGDPSSPFEALTGRELDVLRLLAEGRSNREIARVLHVTEKTVKTHVSSVLAKLNVADRTQAALLAVRERLFEGAGETLRPNTEPA